MAPSARKTAVTLAVLGALAVGFTVVFRTASRSSPTTSRPPSLPTSPTSVRPDVDVAPVPSAPQPPSIPAPMAVSPVVPADETAARAALEASLPPPPSGDYDLNLTAGQIAALVETRYGGLFRTLALAPERLARLRALLAERQQAAVDAANAAVFVGLDPFRDLSTIRAAVEEVQAAADETLRGEMGETVFAAYRDFDGIRRERNAIADLAGVLASGREPLGADQEKRMMEILKNAPGWAAPADIGGVIYGGINERARISDGAIAAAAKVLSPGQLERFRELQRRGSEEDAHRWPREPRSP